MKDNVCLVKKHGVLPLFPFHYMMARCLGVRTIQLLHFYGKNSGPRFYRFIRPITLESDEVNRKQSGRGWYATIECRCMHARFQRVGLIAFLITRSIWQSAAVASVSTARQRPQHVDMLPV
jgi:hypothetical protein